MAGSCAAGSALSSEIVPSVIMTWLQGAWALGCSCDVAENLRNLLLKRASPRTRLMAGRLSRKMSPGIFSFHLKGELDWKPSLRHRVRESR
jgi:hypothetical protein